MALEVGRQSATKGWWVPGRWWQWAHGRVRVLWARQCVAVSAERTAGYGPGLPCRPVPGGRAWSWGVGGGLLRQARENVCFLSPFG